MDFHFEHSLRKLSDGITVRTFDGAIVVEQRWWSLWNAILALIATTVCFVPYLKGEDDKLWLGLACGCVALGSISVSWFQKTVLEVTRDGIRLRHSPVPWIGACSINAASLDQLIVHERQRFDRHGGELSPLYEFKAVLQDESVIHLLGGIRSKVDARAIETLVERLLQIRNRSVTAHESVFQVLLRLSPVIALLVLWAWIFFTYI